LAERDAPPLLKENNVALDTTELLISLDAIEDGMNQFLNENGNEQPLASHLVNFLAQVQRTRDAVAQAEAMVRP
jgi:lipase chaperone LimK